MNMSHVLRGLLVAVLSCVPAYAGDAGIVAAQSGVVARLDGGLAIALGLSRNVQHRVFTLVEPNRLVIDLRDTDLAGLPVAFGRPFGLRWGLFRTGWSRLVLDLDQPMLVKSVVLQNQQLNVLLDPTTQDEFAAMAGAPQGAMWDAPTSKGIAGLRPRAMQEGPVIVAIDAGHGGIDPGAVRGDVSEKDLALTFSLELRDFLEKSGNYAVILTRDDDVFVSLGDRVENARQANADVFLSIHMNTVETGAVRGATIYRLSEEASDDAAQKLAEFENNSDIFAGADYRGDEDQVALALIDLARVQTDARSHFLGEAMMQGLRDTIGVTANHPFWSADLRVLKAPDMPSILVELGFLSSERDVKNMQSREWRERAAAGIVAALDTWVAQDRAMAALP